MSREKIVAFAALTRGDLDTFANDLKRVFPIDDCDCFRDLLEALDQADKH